MYNKENKEEWVKELRGEGGGEWTGRRRLEYEGGAGRGGTGQAAGRKGSWCK